MSRVSPIGETEFCGEPDAAEQRSEVRQGEAEHRGRMT